MNRFRLALSYLLMIIFAFALVGAMALAAGSRHRTASQGAPRVDSRSFEFTYQVHFPATPGSPGPVHLWIPYPTNKDAYQTPAASVAITENIPHAIGRDSEY